MITYYETIESFAAAAALVNNKLYDQNNCPGKENKGNDHIELMVEHAKLPTEICPALPL